MELADAGAMEGELVTSINEDKYLDAADKYLRYWSFWSARTVQSDFCFIFRWLWKNSFIMS